MQFQIINAVKEGAVDEVASLHDTGDVGNFGKTFFVAISDMYLYLYWCGFCMHITTDIEFHVAHRTIEPQQGIGFSINKQITLECAALTFFFRAHVYLVSLVVSLVT